MKILVVDDDKCLNDGICSFLTSNKIIANSSFNGEEGFEQFKKIKYDLVLTDLQMPKIDGLKLLEQIQNENKDFPVIVMTAFASIENAVEAMKRGAEDYLTKPINLSELLIKIEKIQKSNSLIIENNELKEKIRKLEMPEIIGESEPILELKELLRRIRNDSDIPISIYGRSGTGKELVARNIHYMSARHKHQFVPINCATLSEELLESELFGYVKGAFTGALQNKAGLIMDSNGGTIFLDEVSELSPRVQSKFLRVLQDSVIQPVGSSKSFKADVRFICASNEKLSDLVEQKKFREDLFYRLNVIEIEVPTLAARRKDIPFLIAHFFQKYNNNKFQFSKDAIEAILRYNWPGNIRELENLIRMMFITRGKEIVEMSDLPSKITKQFKGIDVQQENFDIEFKYGITNTVVKFEKSYLNFHLKKNDFNITKTAEAINLSRISLHKKIKEYGLDVKS